MAQMSWMSNPFPGSATASLVLILLCILPSANSLGSLSGLAVISNTTGSEVCGIIPGAGISCWRPGDNSQLNPVNLGSASFIGLSGGRGIFCALRRWSMQPFCWDSSNLTSPRRLSSNSYTDISVGDTHICGVRASDRLVDCWRTPSTPQSNLQFANITSGSNFSCGILLVNQTVFCWGREEIQIGLQPVRSSPFSVIQAGSAHVCGLYSAFGAQTYCWGDNTFNQTDYPRDVEFAQFALGQRHSCGLSRTTRFVSCWGDNSTSQLALPVNTSFDSISAGDFYTCGVKTGDLSVICWGKGFEGSVYLPALQSLPGRCTNSVCGTERYPLVNSTLGSGICGGLTEHVCVFCSKCPDWASESAPCVTSDRQCNLTASPPPPPAPPQGRRSGRKLSNVEIVSITLGSAGLLLGIGTVLACFWNKIMIRTGDSDRIHHSANANNGSVTVSQQQQFRRQRSGQSVMSFAGGNSRRSLGRADAFSLQELAAATDNFSEENRIGNGSFGSVYRGVFEDGRQVAIKRGGIGSSHLDAAAKKRFQDKEAAFQSELEFLTRLHHRNLVTLVGFCAEDEERLLVYDFMPNGTVHDHLHGRKSEPDGGLGLGLGLGQGSLKSSSKRKKQEVRNLNSWQARVTVALQAARGIDYLHTYAVPPIIHRDIKSSNILLDSDFSARVSDFGLSLMGPSEDESHLSMTAAGTVGYMDPEYYRLQHLTTKSDVYGFGVVLLELLTGKRAIIVENKARLAENPQLPVNVVDYAVPEILERRFVNILDSRIKVPDVGSEEFEAVSVVADLAEQCVRLEGKERPNMGEIVGTLESARGMLELERRRKRKMKLLQHLSRSRSATDSSSGEIREVPAARD